MIETVAQHVRRLTGKKRAGAALLLGALAALAMPPVYALPVLFISFPCLIWMIDAAPTRRAAFWTGLWFGTGHFGAGLYWVTNAFLVDSDRYAWMIPFALLGLGLLMGLLPAMVAWTAKWFWRDGVSRIFIFAGAWVLFEWVRSWLLTGFPWNLLGYVWSFSDAMLQVTAVTGIYGLSLFTVLAAAMPALLTEISRPNLAAFGSSLIALALIWAGGAIRLPDGPAPLVPNVNLRLVQANIAQKDKWVPRLRERHFARQMALSLTPAAKPVTHVIWPETSAFYSMDTDDLHRLRFAQGAPKGGLIIGGAPRFTPKGQRPFQVWNSLFAVTPEARIVGTYDKSHLVPFGEYAPLREYLPIQKMTTGSTDFSSGDGPKTLMLPGLPPVSPLICYEAIFPGEVTAPDGPRPEWMLNLTNDAWYGRSAGPYQHLAITRVRAVEEGLPLVRVAGTGISGVIDPYGRLIASIGLEEEGVVDSPLPKSLPNRTYYSRYGNVVPIMLIFIFSGIGRLLGRKKPTIKGTSGVDLKTVLAVE